jgi:hypothetical protein
MKLTAAFGARSLSAGVRLPSNRVHAARQAMRDESALRRVSYLILCLIPLLIVPLTGSRALRIPVLHESLGILLFGIVAISTWWLARPTVGSQGEREPLLRPAGALLLTPIALIALLWVGLSTPWDATVAENKMRYAVLLARAIGVTAGFFLLKEALAESGEHRFSTLALAASSLSGAAYVVWTSFQLGDFALRLATGAADPAVAAMNNVFDALLFSASALAYVATAAVAHAMWRVAWLGRYASRAYVALNLIALALLVLRGVSFPSPGVHPDPWFTRPGFIVGIPAIPWFTPYFVGVILLRRASTSLG